MAKAENVRRTIPEKRNRKVKVTQSRLQQIILEEYIKEEALEEALDCAVYLAAKLIEIQTKNEIAEDPHAGVEELARKENNGIL